MLFENTQDKELLVSRLLLHAETEDGTVIPVWEDVEPGNVVVLKDIMEQRRDAYGIELIYDRIPITAERPPDFNDLTEMIDLVLRSSFDTPIVVNCQLGRGRSTLASVGRMSPTLFLTISN